MTALLALAAIAVSADFVLSPAPIPGLPRITMGDVMAAHLEDRRHG